MNMELSMKAVNNITEEFREILKNDFSIDIDEYDIEFHGSTSSVTYDIIFTHKKSKRAISFNEIYIDEDKNNEIMQYEMNIG